MNGANINATIDDTRSATTLGSKKSIPSFRGSPGGIFSVYDNREAVRANNKMVQRKKKQ